MDSMALILFAFFCGSLPFSVWAGKFLLKSGCAPDWGWKPGGGYVFKTGNKLVGLFVLILDISKAAAPVGLAYFTWNMRGPAMCLNFCCADFGHVFSPFLGFKGGKGIATVLGVWIGLTLWKVPLGAVAAGH